MTKWNSTLETTPPDKTMIEVFHKGEQYHMWFESGLFFTSDRSMYVYYTPQYWRPL